MSEEEILRQIRNDCKIISADDFQNIKKKISENSGEQRAEVIEMKTGVLNTALKFSAIAAAIAVPVIILTNMNTDIPVRNNSPEHEAYVGTAVTTAENLTGYTTSAVTSQTLLSSSVTSQSVAVSPVSEPVTEIQTVPDISETFTRTVSETKVTETVLEETKVYETETTVVSSETEMTVKETEKTEQPEERRLYLVPDSKDKLFSVEHDIPDGSENSAVYKGEKCTYRVYAPENAVVYIYDVIIYGYDYFDLLNQGDYVLRSVSEYTLDEILNMPENILTIDDLYGAGLKAEIIENE